MQKDYLEIVGLKLQTHIGVPLEERKHSQEIQLSLRVYLTRGLKNLSDKIENTLDYAELCQFIEGVVSKSPRQLIETLSEEVGHEILKNYPQCNRVEIELRKYILQSIDYVAVHMACER